MITTSLGSVPLSMEKGRQRLDRWRTRRPYRRSPIPPALWALAVALARQQGVYPTARGLHLDYTTLKKRLAAGDAEERASGPPTFVELPGPSALSECVIELEGPRGGMMRMHVKGATLPDLVALSRVVWDGEA